MLSVVSTLARTLAQWRKNRSFSPDDYFCWFATSCYISLIGLYLDILPTIYVTEDITLGKIAPPADYVMRGDHMMRCLFAIQLLFWLTLYGVKFSLLWMFRGLTLGLPRYRTLWAGVVVITAASLLGSVVSELTSCQPLWTYFYVG